MDDRARPDFGPVAHGTASAPIGTLDPEKRKGRDVSLPTSISTQGAQRLRDIYLATVRALVERESPTVETKAVQDLLDWIEARLTHEGWSVDRQAHEGAADTLVARLAGRGDGPSTLLLAHADTVHPVGTTAERPWRIADDRAFGPGVYDMKAGLAIGMHAAAWARDAGGPFGPVTLLINGDEETGSVASRATIEHEAAQHDRVLVLEPSSSAETIVVARKGAGDFTVRFSGRAAHSGDAFGDGISAVDELAHLIAFVRSLIDSELGTTVAVTVVRGGTMSNVIPAEAMARVDLRVENADEAERVRRAIEDYRPSDARLRVHVDGAIKRPPMVLDEDASTLVQAVRAHARALGLELRSTKSGGGSDANFTSALGVPTIDGLGACGGGAHATDEHIVVAPTLERLALVAAILVGPPSL